MVWLLYITLLALGLAIPPGSVDDSLAGVLVTFFGLVAAGVIPAMSLLVGNVMSPARSVASIISLKASLDVLLKQLGLMLVAVIAGGLFVIVLSFDLPRLPISISDLNQAAPRLASFIVDLPERFLQALTLVSLFHAVDRMRVVKHTFKIVLHAQFQLALEEARRRIEDRAPSTAAVAEAFPTPDRFGKRVVYMPVDPKD